MTRLVLKPGIGIVIIGLVLSLFGVAILIVEGIDSISMNNLFRVFVMIGGGALVSATYFYDRITLNRDKIICRHLLVRNRRFNVNDVKEILPFYRHVGSTAYKLKLKNRDVVKIGAGFKGNEELVKLIQDLNPEVKNYRK